MLAVALALPGAAFAVQPQLVQGGHSQLTQVTAPRTGDPAGTLYIVEQDGHVWKRDPGGAETQVFNIDGLVMSGGEQGLLSIAFDPEFASNDLIYVSYTNNAGDTRVARYRLNASHTGVVAGTRRRLLAVDQPASNHNGGQLAFARNGRLYLGLGDGGGSCDPGGRAQNLRSRLGKLLSLNPRSIGSGWRIDAYGVRNPWRFSFDRVGGRLYLADVGQDDWEEVDTMAARRLGGTPENFGWDPYEGRARSGCSTSGLRGPGARVRPINVYSHALGCSVTGGFAYRGSQLSSGLRGWYFFADYCGGTVWRIKQRNGSLVGSRRVVFDTSENITSFGEAAGGELFFATGDGQVYKLIPS